MNPANPTQSSGKFTHVCIDCGALGVAGGYHDHGGDSAGDTIPLSSLPTVIRSFQAIEDERDELRVEIGRLRLQANSARVCLERFRVRPASVDLLATAIRELDDAMEGSCAA